MFPAWVEVTETRDVENKRRGTKQWTECTVKKKKDSMGIWQASTDALFRAQTIYIQQIWSKQVIKTNISLQLWWKLDDVVRRRRKWEWVGGALRKSHVAAPARRRLLTHSAVFIADSTRRRYETSSRWVVLPHCSLNFPPNLHNWLQLIQSLSCDQLTFYSFFHLLLLFSSSSTSSSSCREWEPL